MVALFAQTSSVAEPEFLTRLLQISRYSRLIRVTALLFNAFKPRKGKEAQSMFSVRLFRVAENWWLRQEQARAFKDELRSIAKQGLVSNTSPLRTLTPWLSQEGLLRVGGRIEEAHLEEDTKHPILLPKVAVASLADIHPLFTARLIQHHHNTRQHAGVRWLVPHLRKRFWILSSRRSIASVVRKCVACQRSTRNPVGQKMAPLPGTRLCPEDRHWQHVGVDFCGPFDVTTGKDKTEKDYVAIFTDMTSRAVHMEITSSLSTEAFLLAFRRMAAERGTPAVMYSDETHTFLKAAKELKVLYASLDKAKIQEELAQRRVKWNFNMPHAQFCGGCWEWLVSTFKETLRRNILQQRLRRDVFDTVVKEAQGLMNDRPLEAASEQPDVYDVVTPSMLLAGQRLLGMPPVGATAAPEEPNAREVRPQWKTCQALTKKFWEL